MMNIYLPVAELSIPIYYLVLLGLMCGVVAGLFGLGGNFFLVPFLVTLGVPPSVALSTAIAQTISSSSANFLSNWQNNLVDPSLFLLITIGGILGTVIGSEIFDLLYQRSMIETVVPIVHIILLSYIGATTLFINIKKRLFPKTQQAPSSPIFFHISTKLHFKHYLAKFKFSNSLPIFACSIAVGILISVSGIGVGLVLIPVLIYAFKLPTINAIALAACGTGVTSITSTLIHANKSYTVDIVLALVLAISGIFTIKIGKKIQSKLSPENLDLLFVFIVLGVSAKLFLQILVEPSSPYSIVIPKIQ